LSRNDNIQGRVKELQKQAVIRCEVTVADLISKLEHSMQLAASADTPQASAMVAATIVKAKLLGFLVTRPEVSALRVEPIQINFISPSIVPFFDGYDTEA
jgi:phage terminase small subunit